MVVNHSGHRAEPTVSDEESTRAMMVFKNAIPRRTLLHGLGAAVALPMLDAMVPAFAKTVGTATAASRLSIVYVPTGMIMDKWTPTTEGAAFELTPILQPLTPFRDRMPVL